MGFKGNLNKSPRIMTTHTLKRLSALQSLMRSDPWLSFFLLVYPVPLSCFRTQYLPLPPFRVFCLSKVAFQDLDTCSFFCLKHSPCIVSMFNCSSSSLFQCSCCFLQETFLDYPPSWLRTSPGLPQKPSFPIPAFFTLTLNSSITSLTTLDVNIW